LRKLFEGSYDWEPMQASWCSLVSVNQKLAKEDPPRALALKAKTDRVTALVNETQAVQQHQQQRASAQFQHWSAVQDQRAAELIPELADRERGPELQREAVDIGQRLRHRPERIGAAVRFKSRPA